MVHTNGQSTISEALSTINAYVEAINQQNITQIITLLAEDHVFTNSQDKKLMGKEVVIRSWLKYFELFPDYHIEIENVINNGETIGLFGYSSGTYKGSSDQSDFWKLPSAWKVAVNENLITEWQVYTDNMVPFEIIRKNNMQQANGRY